MIKIHIVARVGFVASDLVGRANRVPCFTERMAPRSRSSERLKGIRSMSHLIDRYCRGASRHRGSILTQWRFIRFKFFVITERFPSRFERMKFRIFLRERDLCDLLVHRFSNPSDAHYHDITKTYIYI